MIVVVDASVLVAELLQGAVATYSPNPQLQAVVAEDQWAEAEHEIAKRLAVIIGQGRLAADQAAALHEAIRALVEDRVIEVIPHAVYQHMEPAARRRVPRDPNDWPPVALAPITRSKSQVKGSSRRRHADQPGRSSADSG